MQNVGGGKVRGLAPYTKVGYLEFSPNSTSDPDSTYTFGSLLGYIETGPTYVATGKWTIVFKSGFTGPIPGTAGQGKNAGLVWRVDYTNDGTNFYMAQQFGAYNTTTRTLTVCALDGTFALAAPAGSTGVAKVKITCYAELSTGK